MEYSEKQIQILEAAENLFAQKGFDGTSVRDIAEEAGVNLAMISYYFGSKEKLFEAMFAYRAGAYRLQIENILQKKELGPMERINLLADQYIDKFTRQQCFHRVMVREQMAEKNEFITQQINELKTRNQAMIRELIAEGQEKGVFRNDIDIPLMMATLTGTISQLVTTQHFYKKVRGLEAMPDAAFQDHIREVLRPHLKRILKAILINDEA